MHRIIYISLIFLCVLPYTLFSQKTQNTEHLPDSPPLYTTTKQLDSIEKTMLDARSTTFANNKDDN